MYIKDGTLYFEDTPKERKEISEMIYDDFLLGRKEAEYEIDGGWYSIEFDEYIDELFEMLRIDAEDIDFEEVRTLCSVWDKDDFLAEWRQNA